MINKKNKSNYWKFIFSSLLIPLSAAHADIQPRNASLNYSQKAFSSTGNIAAPALIVKQNDPHVMIGGQISIGGGLEYGDVDDLFDSLNDLSKDFASPDSGDSGDSSGSGGSSDSGIPSGGISANDEIDWDELFANSPELEQRLEAVKNKVISASALMALISTEGYAKAEVKLDSSFVLSDDLYGGTLLFNATIKGNAKAIGLFEEINFDSGQALAQLKTLDSITPSSEIKTLDLSGGITLQYNPANDKARLQFENDSLLLVKSTQIYQFSLSYSHLAKEYDNGSLYWGVKPNYYRVGLTNASVSLGNITDSEELFDSIKEADYIFENGFDADLGLLWAAEQYHLGMNVKNILESTYKFPTIDRNIFDAASIQKKLDFHSSYTMERQLKLDAAFFSKSRKWTLNLELDANATEGPMKDDYQWFAATAGYASDSWWLPSARVGFSKNLAGTELSYINAGFTVMKYINIDLATALDTVELDGTKLMRGASINIGVQFAY